MQFRNIAEGDSEVKGSMNYKNWKVWYNKILQDFGFSRYEDEKSAKILAALLYSRAKRVSCFGIVNSSHLLTCARRIRGIFVSKANEYTRKLRNSRGNSVRSYGMQQHSVDRPRRIRSIAKGNSEVKNKHPISVLKNLIRKKNAYVFGSGNNLYEGIKKIKKRKNSVFISADGTTSILMAKGIIPDIVVTDLDGNVEDQIKANAMGAIAVIHAHGDNISALKKYVPRFPGTVMGTVQSKPFDGIYNFGGFTDGDRGAFLAEHFHARRIYLVGFDFAAVGKLSCAKNKEIKLKKLKWAERLIQKIDGICFL